MKTGIKLYMRGLGIGIAVTSLILTFSSMSARGEMTDEQVKKRAAELGMVEEDTSRLVDTAIDEAEMSYGTVKVEPVETEPVSETVEETVEETVATDSGAVPEEPVAEDKPIEQESPAMEESEPIKMITLTIARGDTSVNAARKAQEAGLVTSATDFDAYMCRHGYDRKLCIGTYQIPEGSSPEEIANIITKR